MKVQPTILLVEDDPDDRLFFTRAAVKAGITASIQTAANGQEAIDYLTGGGNFAGGPAPDLPVLVVLDLKLPRATGFEVLEQIRQGQRTRHLMVVVLTSSNSETDIARAYALGANGYVVKPSSPDQLLKVVSSIKDYWLTFNRPPADLHFPTA